MEAALRGLAEGWGLASVSIHATARPASFFRRQVCAVSRAEAYPQILGRCEQGLSWFLARGGIEEAISHRRTVAGPSAIPALLRPGGFNDDANLQRIGVQARRRATSGGPFRSGWPRTPLGYREFAETPSGLHHK
jgi:hypothetical protein